MQQWVRWSFLFASFIALTACAKPAIWTKPDYSEAQWRQDRYACEKDARQSGYFGRGVMGEINMERFFARCLESKGYYRVQ